MTEINIAMQQMYENEMHEREARQKRPDASASIVIAVLLVGGIGFIMPSPANWYVWIVGATAIVVLKELL
ncbi:MAG: hypothetical protein AABX98_04315 [Nanoarchaeota archaeon]